MAGLRFEVWTLPWSATFQRVIADLPVAAGQGLLRLSDFASGTVYVPADYTRLSEVLSATAGRMIRVYDGSTVVHEWLAQRVDFSLTETGLAKISGNDLASAFDQAIIYPYDYPTNPTTFQNHVWGGPNILSNPGFELQGLQAAIYEVDVGAASGGTFTLTISADPTGAINYNASDTDVNNAIETGITEINDVFVSGAGSTADPWRVEFVDPQVPSGVMTGDGSSLTPSDTLTVTTIQIGNAEISQSWTKSQRSDARSTPALHGTYQIFRQSSGAEPVNSGSYSHVVSGTQYAGLQQIVQVEPGGTYQASLWVRSNAASQTFRLVIRDRYEWYIDSVEITPTVNVWTQATISDVIIPANVEEVVFRCGNITPSATGTWYFDDAEFNEGLAPAKMGPILTALMDDAATDHSADTRGTILDWVDYTTWTATLDSSSTAWTNDESFTAYRGATYGQTWDRVRDMNYEWRLTPKATPGATTHDLEWYERGNMGTDYSTAASPSIIVGAGTEGAAVVRRIPDRTAVLVEGAEGTYIEDNDATALSNFGRLEKYRGDLGLNSTTTLTQAGDYMLASDVSARTQVTVTLVDPPHTPGVDYLVGDTLNVTMLPLAKTAMRVSQIQYHHDEPPRYVVSLVIP